MHNDCEYFLLQPTFSTDTPISLFLQGQQDDLAVGANLQLCERQHQAHIDSLALAEQVRRAMLPRLQKRFGQDTDLTILRHTTHDPNILDSIRRDSAMLRKCLAVARTVRES